MPVPRQGYYSSLDGFRNYFQSGVPVLIYHKIGAVPSGALRKALYVSPELLDRQCAELKGERFHTIPLEAVCGASDNRARQFVITFDDGFENTFRNAPPVLEKHGLKAIQFLVAGLLGGRNEWDLPSGEVSERLMDAGQVREWLSMGHEIGAHTMTHPDLTQIPLTQAREEIFSSKKSLEDRFGVEVVHFCHPYGHWNPAVRALIEEAGFRTACLTEPGVNTNDTPRLEIRRWTARRPSPRPKEVLARFLDRMFNDRAQNTSPC